MQKPEPYLAKPTKLVKMFREMRHKLHLMQRGPEADYEELLLDDLPSQGLLRLRSMIRKKGYANSLNSEQSLFRLHTKTPPIRGRSVSKISSESKHRILQMREQQYRAAFLEPNIWFVGNKYSRRREQAKSPINSVVSSLRKRVELRDQSKSVPRIRTRIF